MIQVLERAKYDHRKIRYTTLKVSLKPLVCPGVGNLNNMPAHMALPGRDGKNILSDALSAVAVSSGGENFLVVFYFYWGLHELITGAWRYTQVLFSK